MILQLVVIALATSVAVTTWQRERILSLLLLRAAVFDLIREAIGAICLRPERLRLLVLAGGDEMRREPFTGAVRALFHTDQAMYLAGPATVAAFSAWAFSRRGVRWQPAAILFVWFAATLALAGLYPRLSGLAWAEWQLAPVYKCAHIFAAVTTSAAALMWMRRRHLPELRHRAALALGGAELLVAFAGPYAWGGSQGAWTRWGLAQVIWICTFLWIRRDCMRERYAGNATSAD